MLENYFGLAGKKLEDLVFLPGGPRVLRPFKCIARKLPLSWVYRPEIHHTGMECWESDDIAFSLHCQAGYLYWLYGPCRRHGRFDSAEFHAWVSARKKDVLSCWDRLYHNQLSSDSQAGILSKSFIMLFYLEEFLARYPAAKVILLTRTPLEVVPSTVSLVNSVCRRIFPFRRLHEDAVENIYHSVSLYYHRMASLLADPAMAERCLHLKYADLTTGLAASCQRISDHFPGGTWDPAAVQDQSARQARRTSAHHYNAGDFGLSLERIAREVPYA